MSKEREGNSKIRYRDMEVRLEGLCHTHIHTHTYTEREREREREREPWSISSFTSFH